MKLWELKEKLNALPEHDDDLDVVIGDNFDSEYPLDIVRRNLSPYPCIELFTAKVIPKVTDNFICSDCGDI